LLIKTTLGLARPGDIYPETTPSGRPRPAGIGTGADADESAEQASSPSLGNKRAVHSGGWLAGWWREVAAAR
jgi:hypothetical protein